MNFTIDHKLKQAIFFMLLSALCFSVMNATIRYLKDLPTFELVFFRSIGSAIIASAILQKKQINFLGNDKKILIFRSLIGLTSLVLFYKAIQLMPLASAVSLRYLSPFFAASLAVLFLGEKMKKLQWFFFATAFLGVLLLKGFDTRISLYGFGCIMVSAFSSGIVYVTLRKIGNSEHPIVVVNYFVTISTFVSGALCFFDWVTPVGFQWLLLILLGVWGFAAQYFMTRAFALAEANVMSPLKYAEVIFTLIIGFAFLGESQSFIALLAMLIIAFSLFANVWVKKSA